MEAANVGGNEGINCFGCGRKGHYASMCPFKKKQADLLNEQHQQQLQAFQDMDPAAAASAISDPKSTFKNSLGVLGAGSAGATGESG